MTCSLTVPRGMAAALLCFVTFLSAPRLAAAQAPQPQSDLDDLMATVLKHRDENWRHLHDYVLKEKEVLKLDGPGGIQLYGTEREFTWYMREGYLVRSPVRYDKVKLSEADRVKYEDEWLRKEKDREEEHAKKAAAKAAEHRSAEEPPVMDVQSFMREGGEPRFISEAYFLEFKFEPGNYYLAGRDTIEGRDVLKIEYYPTRLYEDNDEKPRQNRRDKEEEEFERKFNKVALITLWVDPKVRQIVKFTFENVDFGFLPGRMLVRVGDAKASMVMGQPFPDTWLPRELSFEGSVTLALGTVEGHYTRTYFDYKQGEVRAKIRHYGSVGEKK